MRRPGRLHPPSDGDIAEAQATAWRLYQPRPYQSRAKMPHAPGATLQEVAAELGVTHQRVAQIEASALRKCRAWCERRGLGLDDLLAMLKRR